MLTFVLPLCFSLSILLLFPVNHVLVSSTFSTTFLLWFCNFCGMILPSLQVHLKDFLNQYCYKFPYPFHSCILDKCSTTEWHSSLLLISAVIPLGSEDMLCIIWNLLNILRLVPCPQMVNIIMLNKLTLLLVSYLRTITTRYLWGMLQSLDVTVDLTISLLSSISFLLQRCLPVVRVSCQFICIEWPCWSPAIFFVLQPTLTCPDSFD